MSFYMSAIGVPLSVFIVIFNIAFEILSRSSDVWISQWTSDNTTHINGTVDTTQRNMRLGVYAGIGALQGNNSFIYFSKTCTPFFDALFKNSLFWINIF